jgi:hypothetical protein
MDGARPVHFANRRGGPALVFIAGIAEVATNLESEFQQQAKRWMK